MLKEKDRILILDAEARSSLAVVRALADLGLEIAVVSYSNWAIAAASKFVDITFKTSDPSLYPKEYLENLLTLLKTYRPKLLIPTTDISLNLCYQAKDEISKYTIFPFPDKKSYETINNKSDLLDLAQKEGINIPQTILIPESSQRSANDTEAIRNFSYPAVLKPVSSANIFREIFIKPKIYYPYNAEEALLFLNEASNNSVNYLLQQKITGSGCGLFALCKKGEPFALFAHQRVLEKPPSGGVSVLSESIFLKETPLKESLTLLKSLSWDGVAMLEFKKDLIGKNYLMEINPRFWGSLQLAVNSGMNFPQLLYKLFCKEEFELKNTYKLNQRLRWELGTLDHLFIKLKSAPTETLKEIFTENSLEFFAGGKTCKNEILRFDDFKPFLAELMRYIT